MIKRLLTIIIEIVAMKLLRVATKRKGWSVLKLSSAVFQFDSRLNHW